MKLNIEKLRRKVINNFTPIGESLRAEGLTDQEIVKAFNNHINTKIRNYYSRLRYNGSRIIINLNKLKNSIKGADSKAEIIFYDKLMQEKIPFKFQYKISPYRVDFLVGDFLIVEIDGPHHIAQKEYDKKRDKYLESYGYKVVRYPIWLIAMDINAAIEQIKEA